VPIALMLLFALLIARVAVEAWVIYIQPALLLELVPMFVLVATVALLIGLLLRSDAARRMSFIYGGLSLLYVLILWYAAMSMPGVARERLAYFIPFYQVIFALHLVLVFVTPAVLESAAVRRHFAAVRP
jgi:hypothetical protein